MLRSLLLATAASTIALGTAAASAEEPAPSRLGVVTATGGTLAGRGDHRVLELHGVAERATWFVDRPFHAAGSERTHQLVPAFFGGEDGPPNAALEVAAPSGRRSTVVVELTRPRLGRRTLRFDARLLDDVPQRMRSWSGARTAHPPRRFGAATLFLDTYQQQCNVSVTVPATSTFQRVIYRETFGQDPQLIGQGATLMFSQTGDLFHGCGTDATIQFADATVPGGTYTVEADWNDPETGSNSTQCSSSTPAMTCSAAPVPSSGSMVFFTYTIAPAG